MATAVGVEDRVVGGTGETAVLGDEGAVGIGEGRLGGCGGFGHGWED